MSFLGCPPAPQGQRGALAWPPGWHHPMEDAAVNCPGGAHESELAYIPCPVNFPVHVMLTPLAPHDWHDDKLLHASLQA